MGHAYGPMSLSLLDLDSDILLFRVRDVRLSSRRLTSCSGWSIPLWRLPRLDLFACETVQKVAGFALTQDIHIFDVVASVLTPVCLEWPRKPWRARRMRSSLARPLG